MAKFSALTTPEVTLTMNQPAFRPWEHLTLTASVVPGRSAVAADTYVAVLLPDGSLLFLQGDGSLTSDLRPIVSNWAVSLFMGQVFAYTFGGGEPLGNYAWLAAFTQPGTLNIIGRIAGTLRGGEPVTLGGTDLGKTCTWVGSRRHPYPFSSQIAAN